MITLAQAKTMLEQQDGIKEVEVCKDEWLLAKFANPVNQQEPHHIVVHPIRERLILKVRVPGIAKAKNGTTLGRVLANLNYDLLLGKAGIDSQDGEVIFEINHPCQDGDVQDFPLEVFARLVEAAMATARDVTLLATHVGMVEAGVPEAVARQFIEQFQGDDDDKGESEETL